jgi:anti-sigma factor RsiW
MTHLGERITDFVFGELSVAEMAEARQHMAECAECRGEVQQAERTYAMLKASPDVEPPRHIVFEAEKRSIAWKWFASFAVAAALVIAVLIAVPTQVQWHDSQLSISFGKVQTPAVTSAVAALPVVLQPAQPIDYDKVAQQVQNSQHEWFVSELKKRDVQQTLELKRLQGQLVDLNAQQKLMDVQTIGNASNIQLLVQRTDSQE